MQLSLFERTVLEGVNTYGTTKGTYKHFARTLGFSESEMKKKVKAGLWGETSLWQRKIRYLQQTLKSCGLIEKRENRGQWSMTSKGKNLLNPQNPCKFEIGFVTSKGIAFYGDCRELASHFKGEVELIFCSPPYLLSKAREYGSIGESEKQYVENLVEMIQSWLPMLTKTGSIVLNIGESSIKGEARSSLANERLLIALEDKLGLHLVQKFIWNNPCKPPSGYWTTKARQRFTTTTENLYWLSLDPKQSKADNRRVLQPYSDRQQSYIEKEKQKPSELTRKTRPSGHSALDSTFYSDNGGAIPKNLIEMAPENANSAFSIKCKEAGLPRHPAMAPVALAELFIKFLTEIDDLVCDPFLGSCSTGYAAEINNRHWCGSEMIREYLEGGKLRF